MADLAIGQRVTWLYNPASGGAFIPVDGIVQKIGLRRVKIEVRMASGEIVDRWVNPENLIARGD